MRPFKFILSFLLLFLLSGPADAGFLSGAYGKRMSEKNILNLETRYEFLQSLAYAPEIEAEKQALARQIEIARAEYEATHNEKSSNQKPNGIINIQREPFYNGYTETTTYADGHKFIVNYLLCKNCGGSKLCCFCQGKGFYITAGYGQMIPCAMCNQTGVCAGCNEEGYYVSTSFIQYPNGQIWSNQSGGLLGEKADNNSKQSKPSKDCSYCNGTGIDPTPCDGGRSSWAGYYNTKGLKCPYCGRYSGHMHNKCPSCNVPNY